MRIATIIVATFVIASASAQAEMVWRSTPEVITDSPGAKGGHRHGGAASFFLRDAADAEVTAWTPDLKQAELRMGDKGAQLKPTGLDGFHLWVAKRNGADVEETALRYLYVPGKPTGKSPAELLAISKARLEIVPAPLPREHWRYESGEAAAFKVVFDGRSLKGALVRMATSNGSFVESSTDSDGVVHFLLPDDFSDVRAGRQNNGPAEFISSVEHREAHRRFSTTLSGSYYVNPGHWQSNMAGIAALVAGFVVGLVMLRRASEANV